MSRIGRLPVAIPAGETVEVAENNVVTVKGPKGTLTRELPTEMEIKVEGEEVIVTRPNDLKKMKSLISDLSRILSNFFFVDSFNSDLVLTFQNCLNAFRIDHLNRMRISKVQCQFISCF